MVIEASSSSALSLGTQDQFYIPAPQPLYLNAESTCFLENGKSHGSRPSLEHIIPTLACHDYRRSLGRLRQEEVNHLSVCRNCHNNIDNNHPITGRGMRPGKMTIYEQRGIMGLLVYVANYPRATDRNKLDRQYNQWLDLFDCLSERLPIQTRIYERQLAMFREDYALFRNQPDMFMSLQAMMKNGINTFKKAEDYVNIKFLSWDKGNFELPRAA